MMTIRSATFGFWSTRLRKQPFSSMRMARVVVMYLQTFWGGAELKSIMSDGYNAYVFIGNELKSARFKDTIHQVCMSHANNKFVKAGNQGGEPVAIRFSNFLKRFFSKKHVYDEAGLTPEKRLRERQSLETKELLIVLRSLWIVNCQRIQN